MSSMVWLAAMAIGGCQLKDHALQVGRLPATDSWEVAVVPNLSEHYVEEILRKEKAKYLAIASLSVGFLVRCSENEAHRLRKLIIADSKAHGYLKYLSRSPLLRVR
ncbi:MAG: hypothetical protein ACHQ50_05250 [Fimbriimonadales bacterium]